MNWVKKVVPKLSFNFKNLFYYKLKEIDGNPSNKFTIKEAKSLSIKYNLNLITKNNVVVFKKKK